MNPSANASAGPALDPLVKPYDQLYTRLVIDPLAVPTARWLAARPWVTPNRITGLAGLLGAASAVCFCLGQLPAGAALFLLRFFVDCLDGKVARSQDSSSHRGAALDLLMDVTGIHLCFASLSWYLVRTGSLAPAVALGLLALLGLSNWVLQYRKQVSEQAGQGPGGAGGQWNTSLPVLRSWSRWCSRHSVSPIPYTVELETLTLGLLPLSAVPELASGGLAVAAVSYLLVTVVNVRRLWRTTGALDLHREHEKHHNPGGPI